MNLLAEKKALRRFLFTYILSTMLIVFIGECFFYRLSYDRFILNEVNILKLQLNNFVERNRNLFFIKLPSNFQIAIYVNEELINYNFKPTKVYFNKYYWVDGDYIYYRCRVFRGYLEVDCIIRKKLDKKFIIALYKKILIFNIFFFIFLFLISILLGKLFLQPMKKVIENLENFIKDITHEMNTPLSVILTNVELLKDKCVYKKYIDRIESAAFRLSKMFENLKYLNFQEDSKCVKNINLKYFIKKRLRLFGYFIENKKLKINLDLEDVIVKINEEDLLRIVDNLLSNAFKYSPPNSTIYIILKRYYLCVINKGTIKDIENITQKYVRENKNEGGFGLGLYIVKKVAEEYNFKLKIETDKENVKICLTLV